MDHLESIVELKNIISPQFIDKIIPLINKKSKKKLSIRDGLHTSIRNVKGYQLNFETPTNIFYWNYIKQEIERLYSYYKIKFPKMSSYKINQIDLLKYSAGGKYEVHTDHYTNSPRHLSIIMNLNNNYEGGDLIFTQSKIKVDCFYNRTVIFPSWYYHAVSEINMKEEDKDKGLGRWAITHFINFKSIAVHK